MLNKTSSLNQNEIKLAWFILTTSYLLAFFSFCVQCVLLALFSFGERVSRRENELSLQVFGKKENRLCERGKYLSYVLLNVAIISGCILPYIP